MFVNVTEISHTVEVIGYQIQSQHLLYFWWSQKIWPYNDSLYILLNASIIFLVLELTGESICWLLLFLTKEYVRAFLLLYIWCMWNCQFWCGIGKINSSGNQAHKYRIQHNCIYSFITYDEFHNKLRIYLRKI